MHDWTCGQHTLSVRILRRSGCRRILLRLQPDGTLGITVPWHYPQGQLPSLLRAHEAWLQTQLAARAKQQQPGMALFKGSWYHLHLEAAPRPQVLVGKTGIRLYLPQETGPAEMLGRWYRQQARDFFDLQLARWTQRLGVQIRSLTVREQRTRWGSCSAQGAISLNWRLILAPPAISEYVVVHELCHLSIPNHSREFWQEVQRHIPNVEERRAWLQAHGLALLLQPPQKPHNTKEAAR